MAPGTLSKILSSEGVLRIDTLGTILKVLGCRLSIEPLKAEETTPDIELATEVEAPNSQMYRHNWLNQIHLNNGGIDNG